MPNDNVKKSTSHEEGRVYNDQIHPAAAEMLYELGANKGHVAKAFCVSAETLTDWEIDHAEFGSACDRGRSAAAYGIETALYQSATGHVQIIQRPMKVHGELVLVNYERQAPPDLKASRFWLTNRSPKYWNHESKTDRNVADDRWHRFFERTKFRTLLDDLRDRTRELEANRDEPEKDPS